MVRGTERNDYHPELLDTSYCFASLLHGAAIDAILAYCPTTLCFSSQLHLGICAWLRLHVSEERREWKSGIANFDVDDGSWPQRLGEHTWECSFLQHQ